MIEILMQFSLGFFTGLLVGGCAAWIFWPESLKRDSKGRFVKR